MVKKSFIKSKMIGWKYQGTCIKIQNSAFVSPGGECYNCSTMIIIISGVSRSGKSTLARKVAHYFDMEYYPFDALVSTFEEIFPESGFFHSDRNEEISPVVARFIKSFAAHLEYEGLDAVIDTYQLFPGDYMEQELFHTGPALWLGYPWIAGESKLRDIRSAEKSGDWTAQLDNDALLKVISDYLGESREMYRQCINQGLPFFATAPFFCKGIQDSFRFLKEETERWREKKFDRGKKS